MTPKIDYAVVNGKVEGPSGSRIKKRWVPKIWQPEYEAIVALSCTGLSNTALAERFGYTKEHISNILCTPEGRKLKQIIVAKVRDQTEKSIPERLARIQDAALKNMESIVVDRGDELVNTSPFALFDRSLIILKMGGIVKDPNSLLTSTTPTIQNNQQNNINIFTSDAIKGMTEAILDSNKVRELHGDVSGNVNNR